MLKKKNGQSTLEYIVLIAAVIAVLLIFLTGGNSPFKSALNATLTDATNGMAEMSGRLNDSRGNNP